MEIIRNKVSHSLSALSSSAFLYIYIFLGWIQIESDFFAESFNVEEGSCNIQLLLSKKDCCPHCHIHILLRGITCYRFST